MTRGVSSRKGKSKPNSRPKTLRRKKPSSELALSMDRPHFLWLLKKFLHQISTDPSTSESLRVSAGYFLKEFPSVW